MRKEKNRIWIELSTRIINSIIAIVNPTIDIDRLFDSFDNPIFIGMGSIHYSPPPSPVMY